MREDIILKEISTDELAQRLVTLEAAFYAHKHDYIGSGSQQAQIIEGYLQSANFKTGVSGYQFDGDGNLEANSGHFRGDISGASGHFTGTVDVNSLAIGSNALHIDSSGNMWWGSSATYAGATIKISAAGSVNLTTGTFSGTLSAAAGTLGTITSGKIVGVEIHAIGNGTGAAAAFIYSSLADYNASNITGYIYGGAYEDSRFLALYGKNGIALYGGTGDVGISGNVNITGSVLIDSGDLQITDGGINTLGGSILLDANNSYSLGAPLKQFADLYLAGIAYLSGKMQIPVGTNLY